MIQTKSKREIWRNTASVFVRFVYGLRIFIMYLKYILLAVYAKKLVNMLWNMKNYEFHNEFVCDLYKAWQSSIFKANIPSKPVMITGFVLLMILGIAFTIWYHAGKNSIASSILYVKDCCIIVCYIYYLCRYPIYHANEIFIFIALLILTLLDFRITRSIFRYNGKLKEEELKYERSMQQRVSTSKHLANYQFAKVKSAETFRFEKHTKELVKTESKIKINPELLNRSTKDTYIEDTKEIDSSTEDLSKDDMIVDTSLGYRRITFKNIK